MRILVHVYVYVYVYDRGTPDHSGATACELSEEVHQTPHAEVESG